MQPRCRDWQCETLLLRLLTRSGALPLSHMATTITFVDHPPQATLHEVPGDHQAQITEPIIA